MKNYNVGRYMKASLLSLMVMTLMVIIHHVYRFGFILPVVVPAIFGLIMPCLLMYGLQRGKNKMLLWIHGGYTIFISLGFGLEDGFLDHVLKALGLPHTGYLPGSQDKVVQTFYHLWSPEAGNYFYETTGVLQTVIGILAIYYCYKFIREASRK